MMIIFKQYLESLNLNIVYLSGSQKMTEKKSALKDIQSGKAQIIIGTHALFQKNVQFDDLALVIIDEPTPFWCPSTLIAQPKSESYSASVGHDGHTHSRVHWQ